VRVRVVMVPMVLSILACDGTGTSVALQDGQAVSTQTQSSSDPNKVDERGISPLLAAVESGDTVQIRAVLQAGADPNAPNVARSALVSAITTRVENRLTCNLEVVRLLLDHAADPNMADPYIGTRPLHHALSLGEVACATLLKERGAKLDQTDVRGTVLDAAVNGAVKTGDMTIIDLPLSWGVSPNVRSKYGNSALATAVWLNSTAAVETLLSKGVDPCIADSREDVTPLTLARDLKRSPEMVSLLEAVPCPSGRAE
jgi:ankyrin repeat protein